MRAKVTFNKSKSGSASGKMIIPKALLEVMKIDEDNRDVEIIYENGKLIITKVE